MENESITAQEKQYCVELNLSGQPCGLRAAAGHDRCYIHGIFRATDNGRCTIDIPLLEDDASLLYVYSQVARALAQGAMPASNANGIIRCCRGAQRLLEEKARRERFEGRKKARQSTEPRAQSSASAAASPDADPTPAQADATVPCNLEHCACAENAVARNDSDAATALKEHGLIGVPGEPARWGESRADNEVPSTAAFAAEESRSDPAGTLQAASCDENRASADESPEPQPWNVEAPLPVVPPPQFADAPEKFQHALDRVNGKQFEALRNRDRAIRERGGSVLKFYEGESQGVRSEIRNTF